MTARWWRRIFLGIVVAALCGSLVAWWWSRDPLPRVIRIAAAPPDSAYHAFATELAVRLQTATGHRVEVLATEGSGANRDLVAAGRAELGLFQHGAVSMAGITAVAPMYPEVVHLVVRRGGPGAPSALQGRRVIVGAPGSGMRRSADEVFAHYGVEPDRVAGAIGYERFAGDPGLVAAMATTGMENPALRRLLASHEYELVPLGAARALAMRHAHFRYFEIPAGYYAAVPPVPPVDTPTVSVISFVGVQTGASSALVEAVLAALYADGVLQARFATMVNRREALGVIPQPVHPVAASWYDPLDRLGFTVTVMETIVAAKELLVALGLACFLLWQRWRRVRERERAAELHTLKERLDGYLTKTMELERQQMETTDPTRLRALRDAVTTLKLEALNALTHESLRGDETFAIFLAQCADLNAHIQAKLTTRTIAGADS